MCLKQLINIFKSILKYIFPNMCIQLDQQLSQLKSSRYQLMYFHSIFHLQLVRNCSMYFHDLIEVQFKQSHEIKASLTISDLFFVVKIFILFSSPLAFKCCKCFSLEFRRTIRIQRMIYYVLPVQFQFLFHSFWKVTNIRAIREGKSYFYLEQQLRP